MLFAGREGQCEVGLHRLAQALKPKSLLAQANVRSLLHAYKFKSLKGGCTEQEA